MINKGDLVRIVHVCCPNQKVLGTIGVVDATLGEMERFCDRCNTKHVGHFIRLPFLHALGLSRKYDPIYPAAWVVKIEPPRVAVAREDLVEA